MLDDVTILFDTLLSAATVMSYWVNPLQIHPFKLTVFPLATWIFNPQLLASQMSLPDFRQIDQRWEWIMKRVVPIFRRLDGTDPDVLSSIWRNYRRRPSDQPAHLGEKGGIGHVIASLGKGPHSCQGIDNRYDSAFAWPGPHS